MYKLDLKKAKEPEIELLVSFGSYKKQGNSRKISTSASLTMLKPLTVWVTTVICWKSVENPYRNKEIENHHLNTTIIAEKKSTAKNNG